MFETPLATDQYSRVMVSSFDEMELIGVPTGFLSFFGRPETGAQTLFSPDSSLVEIDIMRGNEKLAALINRGSVGRTISGLKNTSEEKFSTFSRQYPLIEEVGDINSNQLLSRSLGESPYAPGSKIERLRRLARKHHLEHIRRIMRTCEFLASQSILAGQMPALLGTANTDLIYDFLRKATHTVTVGTAWDQGGATILADLDAACELIREDGHLMPDMAIIGGDAMDALLSNTDVQTKADNRRFELIQISSNNPVPEKYARFVAGGMVPRGRMRTPKGYELWMFTYVDTYQNAAGTAVKYMPDNEVLVASSMARCDRYFGPSDIIPPRPQKQQMYRELFGFDPNMPPMPANIKNMGAVVNPAMFYCDAYESQEGKSVSIRTQAAPIFATTMTDAFVKLDGLITP